MSDSRQIWEDAQLHDDEADGLPFVESSSSFASQWSEGSSTDRPRRPEDALAEIESLERLIAEVSDDRRSTSELNDRPVEPLVVRAVEAPRRIDVPPCFICHGTTATSRFAMTSVPEEMVVCDTCGVGSLFPLPTEQRLAELTKLAPVRDVHSGAVSLIEAAARLRVRWQLRSVPRNGRVLEVISGGQPSTSFPASPRFDAFSVRIDPHAVRPGDRSSRECCIRDLADAEFDSRSFEAVVLRGTLERHPQPQRLLDEVRRVLQPGGLLIATLPNFASWQAVACGVEWGHLGLPQTLHHYTPETLSRLLQRSEFEAVSVQHATLTRSLLQLPFGDRALTFLERVSNCRAGVLQSLIRRSGTMSVTARLSGLQPVDALLRAALPSSVAGAFA